jgi:hypothetical protein
MKEYKRQRAINMKKNNKAIYINRGRLCRLMIIVVMVIGAICSIPGCLNRYIAGVSFAQGHKKMKEMIYVGGKLVAIEESAPGANPTPLPTPVPAPTPTPTPIPTPTPTPSPTPTPIIVHQANYVSQLVPGYVYTNESFWVSITMNNAGNVAWPYNSNYALGSLTDLIWGINRVALPYSVGGGGNVTFDFYVTAPSFTGNCSFQWKMVNDGGIGWFGNPTENRLIQVNNAPSTIDNDADGWSSEEDCDDTNSYIYPGSPYALEECGYNDDMNCNGITDHADCW